MPGIARKNLACGTAKIGTYQANPYTIGQSISGILAKAGIRATGAYSGASGELVQATRERITNCHKSIGSGKQGFSNMIGWLFSLRPISSFYHCKSFLSHLIFHPRCDALYGKI